MSEQEGPSELAAAIDLGTNTTLCVVGRLASDGTLEVLDDRSEMPRLGDGLARSGKLDEGAVERTLVVLAEYAQRLAELGVAPERCRAVSTAVLRRAEDSAEFVRTARERTGLEIEILSGEDEARLGYAAVAGAGETAVVDVGGGSTEVAWSGGTSRASVPVGAVVLTDLYDADVERAIEGAREACSGLPDLARGSDRGPRVVAIGGTAVNLACLDQRLARFDVERADGHVISAAGAFRWARELAGLPLEDRLRMPIEPGREGVLPAGLACLGAALERIGGDNALVSMRGLRYGVLGDILGRS